MFKVFPIEGGVCAAEGFFADSVTAGLKKEEYDLSFVRPEKPCACAAVFTSNRFQAAPVIDAKEK